MTYVDGFVCAVPTGNKEAYRKHAADAAPLFREFGVTRMVENWGDDVPRGKVTDFYGAVQAKDDETIVFSWFEYPDKATRDAAGQKMMTDPRMQAMMGQEMPFDGKRMIYGGFQSIVDESADGATGYVDGYLLPVPEGKKDAYLAMAQKAAGKFKSYGAVRVVEAWSDDVPEGKVTDYQRAVKIEDGRGHHLFLRRMARQGDTRRRLAADDVRSRHAARRRDAVRRQAHVLGRLSSDHRHRRVGTIVSAAPARRRTPPSGDRR